MIGKNRHLFGPSFILKAQFENVQGLVPGNNVRFSGIEIGTVKRINIITDTIIEVVMLVDEISVQRITNSTALWSILNDETLPATLRASAINVKMATFRAATVAKELHSIVSVVKDGKGPLGALINDTSFTLALHEAVDKINGVGDKADELAVSLNSVIVQLKKDINTGKGPANALFKDSSMVVKINNSLNNIQKGTDAFSQNMEALKHNFLFRGYFRKLEKQKNKARQQSIVAQ